MSFPDLDISQWAQAGAALYLAYQLKGTVDQLKATVDQLKSLISNHDTRITKLETKHVVRPRKPRNRTRRS